MTRARRAQACRPRQKKRQGGMPVYRALASRFSAFGKRRPSSHWQTVISLTPISLAIVFNGLPFFARQDRRCSENELLTNPVLHISCWHMTASHRMNKGRELQARASIKGPRSPTYETQSKKPRPGGASPSVLFQHKENCWFSGETTLR